MRFRLPSKTWLRRWTRRGVKLAAVGTVALTAAVAGSVAWVRTASDGHIFTAEEVPPAPVALVLGAQVYEDGTPSPFLAARLDIARRLLETGKVRAILVSGDHMSWGYNEPGGMFRYLTTAGVPAGKVVLDHAGFDTYDSCSRARRVFGVRQAIVVTQAFHLPRAVTLCRRLGVDASGVCGPVRAVRAGDDHGECSDNWDRSCCTAHGQSRTDAWAGGGGISSAMSKWVTVEAPSIR